MDEKLKAQVLELAMELIKTKLSISLDIKETYYAKDLTVSLRFDGEEMSNSSYTIENKM